MEARKESDFDFESWSELASTDPEAFEKRRQSEIDKLIDAAPEASKLRLQRLQFRVDGIRRRSGSALGGCVAISELMWTEFAGQGGLLESLEQLQSLCAGITPPELESSTVSRPKASLLQFPDNQGANSSGRATQ